MIGIDMCITSVVAVHRLYCQHQIKSGCLAMEGTIDLGRLLVFQFGDHYSSSPERLPTYFRYHCRSYPHSPVKPEGALA